MARPSRKSDSPQDSMQLRLDSRTRGLLERAAAYRDQSLPAYILDQAVRAAVREIESREHIVLSDADWQVLADALAAPPAPSPPLVALANRHRIGSDS